MGIKPGEVWKTKDNSSLLQKVELRTRYLPENPRVLDLFCGKGEMYEHVYRGRAKLYHGVDKEKVHSPDMCTLSDNIAFIVKNDMNNYNVFDLDDYGIPYKQLYLIFKGYNQATATVFITDGAVMRLRANEHPTKMISGTDRIPPRMSIPGINRWYKDIFATMLLDIERRYGYRTTMAVCLPNKTKKVYYWALKFKKRREDE